MKLDRVGKSCALVRTESIWSGSYFGARYLAFLDTMRLPYSSHHSRYSRPSDPPPGSPSPNPQPHISELWDRAFATYIFILNSTKYWISYTWRISIPGPRLTDSLVSSKHKANTTAHLCNNKTSGNRARPWLIAPKTSFSIPPRLIFISSFAGSLLASCLPS